MQHPPIPLPNGVAGLHGAHPNCTQPSRATTPSGFHDDDLDACSMITVSVGVPGRAPIRNDQHEVPMHADITISKPHLNPPVAVHGDHDLLTVHEVAALLRCSACTVRRLRYRGHLRAVQVRGSTLIRYQRGDVDALLDRRAAGR